MNRYDSCEVIHRWILSNINKKIVKHFNNHGHTLQSYTSKAVTFSFKKMGLKKIIAFWVKQLACKKSVFIFRSLEVQWRNVLQVFNTFFTKAVDGRAYNPKYCTRVFCVLNVYESVTVKQGVFFPFFSTKVFFHGHPYFIKKQAKKRPPLLASTTPTAHEYWNFSRKVTAHDLPL